MPFAMRRHHHISGAQMHRRSIAQIEPAAAAGNRMKHQEAEAVVQGSRLDWTIVRCAWFKQNFSESYFIDGILAGQLALPV